jgi:hypothetical protein
MKFIVIITSNDLSYRQGTLFEPLRVKIGRPMNDITKLKRKKEKKTQKQQLCQIGEAKPHGRLP